MHSVKKDATLASITISADEIRLYQEYTKLEHSGAESLEAFSNLFNGPNYKVIRDRMVSIEQELKTRFNTTYLQIRTVIMTWSNVIEYRNDINAVKIHTKIINLASAAQTQPIKLSGNLWIFKDYCYRVEGNYSDEQFRLLIFRAYDKERRQFENLKQRYSSTNQIQLRSRPRIPENVRIEVWRRDDGKCARCGSRENLEYDHIVPLIKGGSNTARNIELLCETCNRKKGANVE